MSCLGNVNNYANLLNGVVLNNSLTCSFTWLYLVNEGELITGDQSTLVSGDPIAQITLSIDDGTTKIITVGAATPPIVSDISSLDPSKVWRIDYLVETVGGCSCTVNVFIEPFVPEVITGTSDPNQLPLPLTTLLPSITTHPVQYHEQSFISLSTWSIVHNHGFADPLSIQIYNAAGNIMMVGRSNITINSFDIVFNSPQTGSVNVISKKL